MNTVEEYNVFILDIYKRKVIKEYEEKYKDSKNLKAYIKEINDVTNLLSLDDVVDVEWVIWDYKIISEIDSYGWEWQGEDYWSISCIENLVTWEKIFIKFDGYYNSWDWGEYSKVYLVDEVEVMRTEYKETLTLID